MSGETHRFIRPGQVAPDRPAPDRCTECGRPEAEHQLREALAAVLEALDIPQPATVGDEGIHDAILLERITHTVIFLRGMRSERGTGIEDEIRYLREKLAEHPAEGYKTWDQAVAELRAAEGEHGQAGGGS
jgi:hypothetical protein